MLIQQYIQPYDSDSDKDFGSNEDMEIYIPLDDGQAYQDDISIQHHITNAIPAPHSVLPNIFSPQKHQLYATLKPLERAIMKYMCHHRNHCVLIAELAQAIQASYECTELQFK
ncbi:hypothetical protein J3R83DRAFT_2244 [Lanmaoa asiatica]|nr:hypothetical protein J3R83DRAFT_2244 [Lanmaoa asiatica]